MACNSKITIVNLWKVIVRLKTKEIRIVKSLCARLEKLIIEKRFWWRVYETCKIKW